MKTGIATILMPTDAPGASCNSSDNEIRLIIHIEILITKIQISERLITCAMKIDLLFFCDF